MNIKKATEWLLDFDPDTYDDKGLDVSDFQIVKKMSDRTD